MRNAIGVKILNQYIKRELLVDPILQNLRVEGELSNYKMKTYTYFDLKEDNEIISCVYFGEEDLGDFSNGDKVVVEGKISVYERMGKYQILVSSMEKVGLGKKFLDLEKLKKKLYKKGYFDPARKKPIPAFPKRIGLVTSDGSAALEDFISILSANYNIGKIFFYPSRVQGKEAMLDLVSGLERLNKEDLDLIVITRGGGSKEDLDIFNDELVCDAIYQSKLPVIAAIGHEIDLSLAELVADLRLSTPTKAAEYLAKEYVRAIGEIDLINRQIDREILSLLSSYDKELRILYAENETRSPYNRLVKLDNKLSFMDGQNYDLVASKIYQAHKDLSDLAASIEESYKSILKKQVLILKDMEENPVSLSQAKEGENYYLEDQSNRLLIEVLEKK